jgi:hypothetical protein
MKTYKLHFIEPSIDEKTKVIIEDYWLIENDELLNKPGVLAQKYSLNISQLSKLVKEHSYLTITEPCFNFKECGNNVDRKVRSNSGFISHYQITCSVCREEIDKKRSEEEAEYYKHAKQRKEDLRQQEELRIQQQHKRQRELLIEHEERLLKAEREIKKELERGISDKNWVKLNEDGLDILKKIVEYKDLDKIKKYVYYGNFTHNPDTWGVVNNLEGLGLIYVDREPKSKHVLKFMFDARLPYYLNEFKIASNTYDFLKIDLEQYNKKEASDPDYAGTFTLPAKVILKAEKYVYCGRIQADGAITLKFRPVNDFSSNIKQTRIEREPKHVGDILKDMFDFPRSAEENEMPF